jgi:hypothetical protein
VDDEDKVPVLRRVDWAGLSVFVLSLAVGVTVLVVAIAEVDRPVGQGGGVLASAMTAILGAMVGAVSTYAGLGRGHRPRHRREDDPA